MEESVLRIVDEICDDDETAGSLLYCTSAECRTDAACYVLNRIPQRYVSSARGQAHADLEMSNDQQLVVDLVTLAHEGLRRVTSVRRSFYSETDDAVGSIPGPGFYLPTIKGRLFHGLSFELVTDVEVGLLLDDAPIAMIDSRWQNPYQIVPNTAGTYLFWPAPVPADVAGARRVFEFEIRVEADGFDPLHHFFSIERGAIARVPDAIEACGEHRLPDLYLLPIT